MGGMRLMLSLSGVGYYTVFPTILLLVMSGMMAVPYLIDHPPKRFSLRWLLIASTIIAIWLGLAVYVVNVIQAGPL